MIEAFVGGWAFLTGVMSIITPVVYWMDKRRAVAGRWRVPERTLHGLEMLGGWPGGLMARRWLRHKTRKRGFLAVSWAIIAVHAAGWLAIGWLVLR